MHNEQLVLAALADKDGECTRTQLLNQIQSDADISPYDFISALDTLEEQGEISQREERGTVYVRRLLEKEKYAALWMLFPF